MKAQMSLSDLWLAYFALGGETQPEQFRNYLADGTGSIEYDIVAQALNERFLENGGDHPVPYHDELANSNP